MKKRMFNHVNTGSNSANILKMISNYKYKPYKAT